MVEEQEVTEKIFVGNKDIAKYIHACFYALDEGKDCLQIIGRGNNVKRSIDIAAILLRQYLDVPEKLPTLDDLGKALDKEDIRLAKKLFKQLKVCEIKIGSEKFENRNVSTIEIVLRGKKKDVDIQSVQESN